MASSALQIIFFFTLLCYGCLAQSQPQCGGSFQTKCTLDIGKVLVNNVNNKPIVIPQEKQFYASLMVLPQVSPIDLGLTIFYGSVEMYAARNREPKINDFDLSNLIQGESDYMRLVTTSSSYNPNDMIHVMFRAVGGAASFSAMVSTPSMSFQLLSGYPQTFHVAANVLYKATVTLNSPDNSSVLLTPFTQTDVTLSLKLPSAAAPVTTTDYAIVFSPSSSDVRKTAEISFLTKNNTVISLVWREGNALDAHPVNLVDGIIQSDIIVDEKTSHYYLFTVPANIQNSIAFLVDTIDGDADLYVNPTYKGFYHREYVYSDRQDDDLSIWSSTRPTGRDKVIISPSDSNYIAHGGVYYISVFAFSGPTRFTLRVVLDDTVTTLVEGVTLQDSLVASSYRYYRFYDANPNEPVQFDVNPSIGDADIMISCKLRATGDDSGYPSKWIGHYNVSSARSLEDAVSISPDSPNSCSYRVASGGAGVFYLAVYGYSATTYTITAMHAGGIHRLYPGISATNTVFKELQHFYRLYSSFESQDLTIRLLPQYGDCDLYVKIDKIPTLNDYDFHSNNVGRAVDSISITESDICTNCWLYIMVYGYATSKYTLTASYEDTTLQLTNGMPLRDSMSVHQLQYYTYESLRFNSSINVVLTVVSGGIPDIFMSATAVKPNSSTPKTISTLAHSNAIPSLTLSYVVPPQALVYIAVGSDSVNSTYYIRVNEIPTVPTTQNVVSDLTPSLLTLLEGVPQMDSVPVSGFGRPNKWLYYEILVPAGHETIKVRAFATVGSVQFYATKCAYNSTFLCAHNMLPNSTSYSIAATNPTNGNLNLNIQRVDNSPVVYLLGVYGVTSYAAYQLSYALEHSILELQAGIAVTDTVQLNEVDYFSFFVSETMDIIHISLTTIAGDPDLFVSTIQSHPSESNYTWRSIHFGSDVLDINTLRDIHACAPCNYYIAVKGSQPSTYSLQVTLKSSVPVLQDGMPQSGSVALSQTNYYIFYGHSSMAVRDYQIVLSSDSGNADVYVTLDGSIPGPSNYAYSSNNWYSVDIIDILHEDPAYAVCLPAVNNAVKTCPIRIAIVGVEIAEYTLTITSSVATKLLQVGESMNSQVAISQYMFYHALIPSGGDYYNVRWSVTPISGHVSVFMNCGDDESSLPFSNSSTWSWSPVSVGEHLDLFSLSLVEKGCMTRGSDGLSMFAGVRGDTAATFAISVHQIKNSTDVTFLKANLPVVNSIVTRKIDYYYIRPGASYQDIRFLATAMQGDVDLYVSRSWDKKPHFSTDNTVVSYDFQSASIGDEDLIIAHDKLEDICGIAVSNSPCYFIIAVVGRASTNSRYTLTYSLKDSTVVLVNGLPLVGHVASQRYQYYKFALYQPGKDVLISVSSISGDPDVYIGLSPNTHPSRGNFTWVSSKLGSDSLTLQYDDLIEKRCIPTTSRPCELFLGVFGWRNSSYAITATVQDGFLSPVILLDGVSQSGMVEQSSYQYYKYYISVDEARNNALPKSIKVILTPTDSGDVDLYLRFASPSSAPNASEPGKDHFDYRSVSWANVVEKIEVTFDMPGYCVNCVVYIAAYGYTKGSYTIQATTSGMMSLVADHSVGGNVVQGKFEYYSLYNPEVFAEMAITLTTVLGDADLYITTRKATETVLSIPSKTNYVWRSLNSGSDSLQISYDDPNFCFDCEYIIGVYGYRNCTYTLLSSTHRSSLVKLAPNRPQLGILSSASAMQYFTTYVTSSTADMTITLTSLNTGSADLYVQIYNATKFASGAGNDDMRFPDPHDVNTYTYTTAGTAEDHIFIPGPHQIEDVMVIAVVALQPVRFLLVAASAGRPTLLQSGIPQYHYVEQGQMEYFRMYPDDTEDDIRITVTARTGDPDLFISTKYTNPHCSLVGTSQWQTSCSNFTWSSRMFYTDQIIISRDYPCEAVLPSTYVTSDCDPNVPLLADAQNPVYIGVYGYKASKYSILSAHVGQQIQLLTGMPQLSSTAPSFICDKRSPETGYCLSSSRVSKKIQVAYFAFHVSPQDMMRRRLLDTEDVAPVISDVLLTVVSQCNASSTTSGWKSLVYHRLLRDVSLENGARTDGGCAPGCLCNPLQVYITSCPMSQCTELHRKPSEYNAQHSIAMTVSAENSGSTLFISPGSSGYCDPVKANEDCAYYVAVTHSDVDTSGSFSITARTAADINLIPCDAINYPDQVRFTAVDYLNNAKMSHYYEVCSQGNNNKKIDGNGQAGSGAVEKMIVEIDQCSAGNITVFACADDNKCKNILPSADSYAFKANSAQSCAHSFPISGIGKDSCTSNVDYGKPRLMLPSRTGGNYFLMTKGVGYHSLTVKSTVNNLEVTPTIMLAAYAKNDDTTIRLTKITDKTLSLAWQQARMIFPGYPTPVTADFMTYRVYLFNTDKVNFDKYSNLFLPTTYCGLQRAETNILSASGSRGASGLSVVSVPVSTPEIDLDTMSHTFSNMKSGTKYYATIVAVCDSNCLRQVSKVLAAKLVGSKKGTPYVNCNAHDADCKPQAFVYSGKSFVTTGSASKDDNDDTSGSDSSDTKSDNSSMNTIIAVSIVLVVFISIVMIGIYAYWYKIRQLYDDFYPVARGGVADQVCEGVNWLFSFFGDSNSASGRGSSGGGGGYDRVGVNSNHGNSMHSSSHSGATEMIDLKRFANNSNSNQTTTTSNPVWTQAHESNEGYVPPSNNNSGGGNSGGLNGLWSSVSNTATSLMANANVPWGQKGSGNANNSSNNGNGNYRPVASKNGSSPFVLEGDDDEEVEVSI